MPDLRQAAARRIGASGNDNLLGAPAADTASAPAARAACLPVSVSVSVSVPVFLCLCLLGATTAAPACASLSLPPSLSPLPEKPEKMPAPRRVSSQSTEAETGSDDNMLQQQSPSLSVCTCVSVCLSVCLSLSRFLPFWPLSITLQPSPEDLLPSFQGVGVFLLVIITPACTMHELRLAELLGMYRPGNLGGERERACAFVCVCDRERVTRVCVREISF